MPSDEKCLGLTTASHTLLLRIQPHTAIPETTQPPGGDSKRDPMGLFADHTNSIFNSDEIIH